jgi:hypothetical protein
MTEPSPVVALMGRLPEPGLEATLVAVRLGMVPAEVVLRPLSGWPLVVLDDAGTPGLAPLLLEADDGSVLVAAFTSPDRIGSHADASRRARLVAGGLLARGARDGVGIWINPGSQPSMIVAPDQVAALRAVPPEVVAHTPGSRPLTALEAAIAAANAGLGAPEQVAEAALDADLTVLSTTDPAEGGLSLLHGEGPAGETLLAWTGQAWTHPLTERGWGIRYTGRDLQDFLGRPTAITLNPGTGMQFHLPPREA